LQSVRFESVRFDRWDDFFLFGDNWIGQPAMTKETTSTVSSGAAEVLVL
jgi:hypothetical protein